MAAGGGRTPDAARNGRRQMGPEEIARKAAIIRRHVIRMIAPRGQGYVAQGLGAADLFATLYFGEMTLEPSDPTWAGRDRFYLSTAHNSAVFHATLAERGLIPPAALEEYCRDGSTLEINVSERLGPAVEATLGSLGQGPSVAVGAALAAKRRGEDYRCYVMLGDGEMQEGQVWEAAMAAASFRLDSLCVIIDMNWMQVEGHTDKVHAMAPVADKWRAFGWAAEEVDGHDIAAVLDALDRARAIKGQPSVIIAETLVGKGAPCLEGIRSHNMRLPQDVAAKALAELEGV